MSDVYHDPVGDRLRAHDQEMRRVRWVNARDMTGYVCIAVTIVGVAWAGAWTLVTSRPAFATGFSTTTTSQVVASTLPWCESRDERLCPTYGAGGVVLSR